MNKLSQVKSILNNYDKILKHRQNVIDAQQEIRGEVISENNNTKVSERKREDNIFVDEWVPEANDELSKDESKDESTKDQTKRKSIHKIMNSFSKKSAVKGGSNKYYDIEKDTEKDVKKDSKKQHSEYSKKTKKAAYKNSPSKSSFKGTLVKSTLYKPEVFEKPASPKFKQNTNKTNIYEKPKIDETPKDAEKIKAIEKSKVSEKATEKTKITEKTKTTENKKITKKPKDDKLRPTPLIKPGKSKSGEFEKFKEFAEGEPEKKSKNKEYEKKPPSSKEEIAAATKGMIKLKKSAYSKLLLGTHIKWLNKDDVVSKVGGYIFGKGMFGRYEKKPGLLISMNFSKNSTRFVIYDETIKTLWFTPNIVDHFLIEYAEELSAQIVDLSDYLGSMYGDEFIEFMNERKKKRTKEKKSKRKGGSPQDSP